MKRLSVWMAVFLAVSLLFSFAAHAADNYVVLYGFAFDIQNGEAVIHGYDGRSADPVIPRTLMNAPVAQIDDYAFFENGEMTSVSFGNADHLSRIGISAFYGCTGLTEVTIPSTVEELGFGAFQGCSGLKELTIEDGLTAIPSQCFYHCRSLEKAVIPASVVTIGENAFDGCEKLTIYCVPSSFADQYAQANDIPRRYTVPYYVRGDADGDDELTILDATRIQRALAGFTVEDPEGCALRGDVSGNGLDILDATFIQRWLAGFEDPYGINEPVPIV